MSTAELMEAYKAPWGADTFQRLHDLLSAASPEDVDEFAANLLGMGPDAAGFLETVIAFFPESALNRFIRQAVDGLDLPDRRELCEAVIAHASLQQPEGLRPFLPRLFERCPNESTHYENWPWRGGGLGEVEFLKSKLAPECPRGCRVKAFECLLETRRADAFALAQAAAQSLQQRLDLKDVGHKSPNEPLFTPSCFHLMFPPDYLPARGAVWNHYTHPTWNLVRAMGDGRFGGRGSGTCGLCNGTLHHLLTLPEDMVFPEGSSRESSMSLQVCLSCLGWEQETLFYHHGDDGRPEALDEGSVEPQFLAEPLQEIRVGLAQTPSRWKWQDWMLSNGRENLNRVGGYPSWVQSADFPNCPGCGEPMRFITQLDSALPTAAGDEWLWGSGGLCYGFSCSRCRNTAFLYQCS